MAAGTGPERHDMRPRPPRVSFELFPPRPGQGVDETVAALARFGPRFLSVTCGAGGSRGERTGETVRRLAGKTAAPIAAHLTCASVSRATIAEHARAYHEMGIRHLVALRGDPPRGESCFRPHPDGYDSAASLVAGLRRIADFDISVAGYPEVHPEARSASADLDNLARKVDAGASRVITQVFFDNADFLRFRDRAVARGIAVPIVPGILPIAEFDKVARFCRSCGARIPRSVRQRFAGFENAGDTTAMIGAAIAGRQCLALIEEGVDEFHIYTMNRSRPAADVCRMLGLRPAGEQSRIDEDERITHVA